MNILKQAIKIIFVFMFIYILILLLGFDNVNYYAKKTHLINNIYSIFFIVTVFIILFLFNLKKEISNKLFIKLMLLISFIVFVFQFIVIRYGLFYSCWDAGKVYGISEDIFYYGRINDIKYLTMYPNNIFLVSILVMIKSIPLIGTKYITTLVFNILLVNLSGIFASLTIKNILNNRLVALLSYLVLFPLILISPWILIPYSDTFAILFPILMIYIYSKDQRNNLTYFIIGFISIVGFLIKPTVIIVTIAILLLEFMNLFDNMKNKTKLKKQILFFVFVFSGMLLSYSFKYISRNYIGFKPDKNIVEFNLTHYLAMGENDYTNGIYSKDDVDDSLKHGMKINIPKFKQRITSRSLLGQIKFFSKKTLINYNESAFAWGGEGNFYCKTDESRGKIQPIIRNIYYESGKYYDIFISFLHWIWLFTIFFMPYIVKRNNKDSEMLIILSIVGINLFLTIFECRSRYLYCYSPVYVVCSVIGIYNLKTKIHMKFISKGGV